MPDIDIDFDDRAETKFLDYVVNKYGRTNVQRKLLLTEQWLSRRRLFAMSDERHGISV